MGETLGFVVKVYRGLAGLESLESEWLCLSNELFPFYQRYEWYHAHLSHLEKMPDDVYFFLAYKNNQLLLILPLRRKLYNGSCFWLKTWETPRQDQIDLYDFVAINKECVVPAFQAIMEELNSNTQYQYDIIFLQLILEGGNAWNLISDKSIKNKIVSDNGFSKHLKRDDALDVAESWGTGKFRRNLRRLEKRLKSKGELSIQSYYDIEECREIFPVFLEIEAASWKGEKGTKSAIKFNENAKNFYLNVLESFSRLNKVRMNILELNGQPIAGQFCILDNNRVNLLKIGHDQEFNDCSPGFLLIKKIFEDGCGEGGFSELSFVTGGEWNDKFRPRKLKVKNVVIINSTLKGFLYSSMVKAKLILKTWLETFSEAIKKTKTKE